MRPPLKRCPWCANPAGCEGCSLSGDPAGNYVLLSEAEHGRRVSTIHARWLGVVACLLGMIVALGVLWFLMLLHVS